LNRPAKGSGLKRSGRELTPLSHRSSAVELEVFSIVEVAFLVEMVVD
jgi:hypothetical protein